MKYECGVYNACRMFVKVRDVWREVFVFLCCRHMYLLTHSRIFLFINIFCSFGHLLAMTRVCLETINILCLFWWFSLSNISMGWNVVSLWIKENLNFLNVLQYFCAIWFCAILHLILCNILHLIFVCWYIFFIFVAVQHYRFKNFYLFIFCILHSAYPNLRRYSFLVALLVLY